MQALLRALHGLAVNNMQQAAPHAQAVAPQAAAPEAHGGMLQHFLGGGFGQAMTQGIGMGAGFELADSVINSIF